MTTTARPDTALPGLTAPALAPAATVRVTPADRAALGRAARAAVPRSSHADPGDEDARDPVALVEAQAQSRVPELVPIRHGRMTSSPFAYYRGAALPMAADLARTPTSGIRVQVCGDAHLLNFGLYNTPERSLVFDINDFDETLPGPWEWDVKRLAASFVVAGRERGFSQKQRAAAVLAAVGRYRTAMAEFAGWRMLDVWYARLGVDDLTQRLASIGATRKGARVARTGQQQLAKAATRTNLHAVSALTRVTGGRLGFVSQPPLVERLEDLLPERERARLEEWLEGLLTGYLTSVSTERRWLLGQYGIVDMARKVVGVGSVGTRCWIILLTGRDIEDALILQAKEAQSSVLEPYLEPSTFANNGERVVTGQRLMQAASDIVLGWDRVTGMDGRPRDFYVRQLRDGKGSVDITKMVPEGLTAYGEICGWTLARAHARSGDRIAIAAYLGSSDVFDRAVLRFAEAYADRNERDHAALVQAVADGRLQATPGV
jgi:uncharacterized protein (DUF2252 family)